MIITYLSIIIIVILVVYFPKYGIYSRLTKTNADDERILMENALKHIYNFTSDSIHSNVDSIAGNLHITRDRAYEITKKLSDLKLVKSNNGILSLTAEGRIDALRIIRIHRVLESYAADQTGMSETDWHKFAEAKEHEYSEEEIEKLAAKIGNPLFDPHGDPIPSPTGEIKKQSGVILNELDVDDSCKILHLEDEPETVFAQISALGLYPGMQLTVLAKSSKKIVFEANGEECTLAPIFAENITVEKIQKEELLEVYENLSNLSVNGVAEVVSISGSLRGLQRRRLMDFGIVPGTQIRNLIKSPSGDPTAFEVRGTLVAIRKNQQEQIFIKKLGEENQNAA